MNKLKVILRFNDSNTNNKIKPPYITEENCLKNLVRHFSIENFIDIMIFADNISDESYDMLLKHVLKSQIKRINIGTDAGTFRDSLEYALTLDDNYYVYFAENDYLHREGSREVLLDGLKNIGASFASLYDHPDKYLSAKKGGNPYIEDDEGEVSKVYCGKYCHWKLTNSTTMAFATSVKTLKQVKHIIKTYISDDHSFDFNMFIEIREMNKSIITPIPSYSTHGETAWLAPLIDWEREIYLMDPPC